MNMRQFPLSSPQTVRKAPMSISSGIIRGIGSTRAFKFFPNSTVRLMLNMPALCHLYLHLHAGHWEMGGRHVPVYFPSCMCVLFFSRPGACASSLLLSVFCLFGGGGGAKEMGEKRKYKYTGDGTPLPLISATLSRLTVDAWFLAVEPWRSQAGTGFWY